jgi:hypothetical protein
MQRKGFLGDQFVMTRDCLGTLISMDGMVKADQLKRRPVRQRQ